MKKGLVALLMVLCCGFVCGEDTERKGYCSLSFRSSVADFDLNIKEDVFLNLIPEYKEYMLAKNAVTLGIDFITTTFDLRSYGKGGDWVWNSFRNKSNGKQQTVTCGEAE